MKIHTSDLSAVCPRQRQLRRQGNYDGIVPKAMFRGLVAGQAIENLLNDLNNGIETDVAGSIPVVGEAMRQTLRKIEEEGQVPSDFDQSDVAEDVTTNIGYFIERLYPMFQSGGRFQIIGNEVPVQLQIEDGLTFESHIDLLAFDMEKDCYHIIDWKWTQDAPAYPYTKMNIQMLSYWLAIQEGQCYLHGFWTDLDQREEWNTPLASLVWLPGLMPYSRRTTLTQDGQKILYFKGDQRPMDRILRSCIDHDTEVSSEYIRNQIRWRARMLNDEGVAPTTPTATGCLLCSSKAWCEPAAEKEVSNG